MSTVAHCGGSYVKRHELDEVPVPPPEGRHFAVPYGMFVDQLEDSLGQFNYEVVKREFILAQAGQQMFGYFRIARPETAHLGYGAAVGFRGSYNKTLSNGMTVGSDVFICDNLAFSGSFTFFRKNTSHAPEQLPDKILVAVAQMGKFLARDDERYQIYRGAVIDQRDADHLTATLLREHIISTPIATKLITEWYEPSHAEHEENGNTVWRYLNAATEAMKAGDSVAGHRMLPARTMKLQDNLDKFLTGITYQTVDHDGLVAA